MKDAVAYIHKYIKIKLPKSTYFFDLDIGFTSKEYIDNENWNDFDNVIILDEEFDQPYTPFYHHFGEEVDEFPVLENLIEQYNEYMKSLPFLEEAKDDEVKVHG